MNGMLTPYGEKLNASRPWPEYPRPQMVRDSFLNLNGVWDYAITKQPQLPSGWDGKIKIPYAPESLLSGVSRVLQPDEYLWYKNNFLIPDDFMVGRLLLHFGGVDSDCTVYLNGEEAGRHQGGYFPFTFDITDLLSKDGIKQELVVMVTDKTDEAPFARGTQRLNHGGRWHTPQSGIWQTVWLESVPETYIQKLSISPLYDENAVEVTVLSHGGTLTGSLSVYARSTLATQVDFTSGTPTRIELPGALSWHPKMPFLYTLKVTSETDSVESYFGMRKLHIETGQDGFPRLMLNNKPFLGIGVLDQGLFSDGLYTPPSDRAMQDDIRFAKECGFNMIRKDGKIEPLRWYYYCDKFGLLVWQDLPAGGGPLKSSLKEKLFPQYKNRKDSFYLSFGRENALGRQAFLDDMEQTADLLHNSPAVAVWVLFQRGQGQFDAAANAEKMKSIDPSRLVDHASGWYDQGGGDILSIHLTPSQKKLFLPQPSGRALFITETGGFGLQSQDNFCGANPAAGAVCSSRESFAQSIANLYQNQLLPLKEQGLCGFFFRQLSDSEDEIDGLLTFNRRERKIHPKGMATLNALFTGDD